MSKTIPKKDSKPEKIVQAFCNSEGIKLNVINQYKIFGNSINYLLENQILEIPTYIKLDVDGIEHLILKGADAFLNHKKIKSISIIWIKIFCPKKNTII